MWTIRSIITRKILPRIKENNTAIIFPPFFRQNESENTFQLPRFSSQLYFLEVARRKIKKENFCCIFFLLSVRENINFPGGFGEYFFSFFICQQEKRTRKTFEDFFSRCFVFSFHDELEIGETLVTLWERKKEKPEENCVNK